MDNLCGAATGTGVGVGRTATGIGGEKNLMTTNFFCCQLPQRQMQKNDND
jgi:hypothetical protein